MDEIYTYVQKNKKEQSYGLFHISEGKSAVKEIYRKVKKLRPNISHIHSDANRCYDIAFSEMKIPEQQFYAININKFLEYDIIPSN